MRFHAAGLWTKPPSGMEFRTACEARAAGFKAGLLMPLSRNQRQSASRGADFHGREPAASAGEPVQSASVTVVTRQRIRGATNGSSTYLLSICNYLKSNGFEVDLLQPNPATFGRWPVIRLSVDMAVFRSIRAAGAVRLGDLIVALSPAVWWAAAIEGTSRVVHRLNLMQGWAPPKRPYVVTQPWSSQEGKFVARHTRQFKGGFLIDYAFVVPALSHVTGPGGPAMVLMHDLFSSRTGSFAEAGVSDHAATLSRAEEMTLLAGADAVVAIQAEEAELVRRCLPQTPVVVAPMAYTPVDAPQPGSDGTLLFVGSDTTPNVDGLRWFLDHVWPLLRSSGTKFKLKVAGSVGNRFQSAPDVEMLGFVDDLAPLYAAAAVVVCPLRAGSGLKIKTVEALAHGKAIVATGVSVQGIADLVEGAACVTDDPATFAASIIKLNDDPDSRRGRCVEALQVVKDHFSPNACYAEMVRFFRQSGGAGSHNPWTIH